MWMIFGAFLTFILFMVNKQRCPRPKKQKNIQKQNEKESDGWESASDTDDEQIVLPNRPEGYEKALSESYPVTDLKMMMAVRNDLKMTKGKMCA